MDITTRSAEIQEILDELDPDVAFLLEIDTRNYLVNDTYTVRGYKQFASKPAKPDKSDKPKT